MAAAPSTTPFSLDSVISSAQFDQLYELALYAVQASDQQVKLGIAESAAARGQAWMEVGALLDAALNPAARAAIARAPLDVLLELLRLAIQLQIAREGYVNNLDVEAARTAGALRVLDRRYQLTKQLWDEWLPFAQAAFDDYYSRVDVILGATTSFTDPETGAVLADFLRAQASAIGSPILPPSPPSF